MPGGGDRPRHSPAVDNGTPPRGAERWGRLTCVAGIAEDGAVWLGADAGACVDDSWTITVRRDPKVFELGDLVVGFTSSYRMGQLLRFALKLPARPAEQDPFEFMVTTFVEQARRCLEEGGWRKTTEGRDEGGQVLVGCGGRLFTVESDFQVAEPAVPEAAIGHAGEGAMGALVATRGLGWEPQRRLALALEAAEHLYAGIRGPYALVVGGRDAV